MRQSVSILKKALRQLCFGYFKNSITCALAPIGYTRTKEIPTLLDVSGVLQHKDIQLKILDIGSPQILSIFLSNYSNEWDVTYINPYEKELYDLYEKRSIMRLDNLRIRKGDITIANCCSSLDRYDYIFSCSVFEHIYPEQGGDTVAARNVACLLKKNGIFAFSVPYYKEGFHEYKHGQVYFVEGAKGERLFFQRFYDAKTLYMQIIDPCKMTVVNEEYIGERFYFSGDIRKRLTKLVDAGYRRLLLGRCYFTLSSVFMTTEKDPEKLKKPYLAIIALRKE